MAFFNKKKKLPPEPPAPAPAPAPKQSAMPDPTVEPTLDRAELLSLIKEQFPQAENDMNTLLFRKQSLNLTIEFGEMRCVDGLYNVQLLFVARHPWFDEDLVESVAGVAPDPDTAMRIGTREFCEGVLPFLLAAFDCQCENFVDADVMGEKHTFRIPCLRPVLHKGEGKGTDLYEIVKEELPHYLGTKRCYWVKLFSAKVGKEPICEVRINGIVYPDITELLMKESVARGEAEGFISDKQFLLFIQQEETYKPCPFSKQDVGEMTFRALRLMQNIQDVDSAESVMRTIYEGAGNHSLGIELTSFIAEIMAQTIVDFRDSDILMPVVDRGEPDARLRKSQVRSYGYIEDAVFQFLTKQHPTEEEVKQIMAISAKFHALSEAIEKDIPLEELRMSPLVYFVDKAYRPW